MAIFHLPVFTEETFSSQISGQSELTFVYGRPLFRMAKIVMFFDKRDIDQEAA